MHFFLLVFEIGPSFFEKAKFKCIFTLWMLVLLAIIKPLTLWAVSTWGLFLLKATCIEAGPQSIKLASLFYLTLWSDLWIWVASTYPWIMFKIAIYFPFLVGALTIILFGWSNLLITSRTVVFRIFDICLYIVRGV